MPAMVSFFFTQKEEKDVAEKQLSGGDEKKIN